MNTNPVKIFCVNFDDFRYCVRYQILPCSSTSVTYFRRPRFDFGGRKYIVRTDVPPKVMEKFRIELDKWHTQRRNSERPRIYISEEEKISRAF